jgi:signal transduction histidine kinase
MKLGIGWRLTWFAAAILAVALAIAWTAWAAWNQARQFNKQLSKAQVESFEIADHFQAIVLKLNATLRHYQATRSPSDWEQFHHDSVDLDKWIDVKLKVLTNPNENQILNKMNAAYDTYTADVSRMTNVVQTGGASDAAALFEHAENQVQNLFTLGNQLAQAHRASVDALIASTKNSLPFLLQLIFGLLIVFMALGAWVAVVVYRDMIAPLRVKLIETHALMERQEKLASLGGLAAGVAHEIRNPLTAIKARLFTQQKRLTPGSPEAEDGSVINEEINRLERIVRDFLQFARPAEPRLSPTRAETPLRQVRDLMAAPLEKRGIRIVVEPSPLAEAEMDLEQIKQVLINLVQNATESIGQNGLVTLRVRTDHAQMSGASRAVVILEVEDTGKGISPEVQKRLFDPFFTTKETGTGLGLAIAARIVEKHGGLLEFQTQLNHGTVFGIVLPRSQSDESPS